MYYKICYVNGTIHFLPLNTHEPNNVKFKKGKDLDLGMLLPFIFGIHGSNDHIHHGLDGRNIFDLGTGYGPISSHKIDHNRDRHGYGPHHRHDYMYDRHYFRKQSKQIRELRKEVHEIKTLLLKLITEVKPKAISTTRRRRRNKKMTFFPLDRSVTF
uniref:Transposase n=1 Tax=Strongyloides venezuelensis TaxID=75913 RepID=A0A0K0FW17_STRVS